MARSKNQFLQNVHTTEKYSLAKIADAQLKDGEIAVFQNTDEPSLGIKVEDTYAQFKDSKAVTDEITSAITSAKTELSATIQENITNIGKLDAKFENYATTGALATAKTELTKDYDGKFTAIKGDGYTEGTLVSIKSEIGVEKERINAILKDAPSGLTSFKAVDDKIKTSISSVYKVKGTKATYAELPIEGNNVGDVYNVTAANGNTPAGTNYVCTATTGTRDKQWDALGGTVDLSTYATKTYVNDALTGVTGTGKDSIVTKLTTAESDITKLKESASTLNTNVQTIKGWKINDKFISGFPILNGTDIKVDNTEGAQTLKEAIAEAKAAGTAASSAVETLRGGYKGTIQSINNSVTANTSNISQLRTNVDDISPKANSAVQTITVTHTETNKITATKAKDSTEVVLNFDNMVIDCGEF